MLSVVSASINQSLEAGAELKKILARTRILCSTIGACKELRALKFKAEVLIVDEASLLRDPSLALPLSTMERPHLVVMAGDPTQGLITQYNTNSPTDVEMSLSTLSRLADQTADPLVTHHILQTNRRQHPELAEFASSNLCPAPMHCTRPTGTSGAKDMRIVAAMRNGSLGFRATSNLVEREAFVNVNGYDMIRAGTEDLINVTGDMAIVQIVQNLLRINQVSPRDIVVLTPYGSDAQSINTALATRNIADVEWRTPDLFMDAEASIVIEGLQGGQARETTSRAQDVEEILENDQQDAELGPLPDWLSKGYTDWIRKSYKPCNF